MGLAAKAFLTGFMKEAATSIKEENERLENYALTRANQLIKEMDEFEEEKKKFESEFDQQARDLTMYIQQANPNLSQKDVHARVSGIIYKGQGKRVISMFEAADNRLTAQMADAFKLEDEQLKSVSDDILNEIKKQMSTGIKKPGGGVGVMPSRGAWGLPVPESAYRGTMEQAANTRGKTLDEFGAQRLPRPEEIDTPLQKGRVDLSVFKGEESVSNMQDRLIKTIIDPSSSEEEKDSASKTLGEIGGARALLKAKEEGISFKESDIRANLRNYVATIKERMAGPGNTKRVLNPETNSVDIIYGKTVKPDEIRRIESAADTALSAFIGQYYSVNGTIPEPVRRVAATFTASPMAIRVGTGGAGKAAGEVPQTGKPTKPAGILPSPKTKEEYDAIPSGTRYIDTDGKTKIKS